MDLRQIQYFVTLCEEQSITKTARRLHVVQPAVSMQIRKLETDFGVVLFDRTPQGVYPNALAKELYQACLKILANVRAVREQLQSASGQVTGTLAVGVPPSLAFGLLHELLISFARDFPKVHVQCHEGYSGNLVEWLLQGGLDFAVVSMLGGEKRLRFWPLLTEDLMVVGHPGLKTADAATFPAKDLTGCKLVLPSSANLVRITIDMELEAAGLAIQPDMEVDSLSTVMNIVTNEPWVSILPETALRGPRLDKALTVRRLVEPHIQRTLVVAFQPAKEPGLAGQKFIQALGELLKADQRPAPAASNRVMKRIRTT